MDDDHGQPRSPRLNALRRSARDVDELLGICKGLVADGTVNQAEAKFLRDWLQLSSEAKDEWPGDLLFARVESMLRDGRLDPGEEGELLELLVKVTGGDAAKLNAASLTTGLPITEPVPELAFPGRRYCFTGKFVFGPRSKCEVEVLNRGGDVEKGITKRLNYLVIGVVGSRDWIHSSFGRKIEEAVTLRNSGLPISIVSEQHFVAAIQK